MGLFVEGHVCIQCEISTTKSIVLAYSWKAIKKIMCYRTGIAFFYFIFEGNFQVLYKSFPLQVWEAYFQNFRKEKLS